VAPDQIADFERRLGEVIDAPPAEYRTRFEAARALTPEVVAALDAVLKRVKG